MVYGTYNKTATPKTSVESRAHACMACTEARACGAMEARECGSVEGWGSTERRARKRPAREARTRKREHIHKLYWIAEYRKQNGVPPIFTVDCDDTR
jgi:hypothetical protein